MTLCQRIYACSDVKTAKKAWYIAGFLEYPVMAFMGVILGIYAKVAFELGMFTDLSIVQGANIDSEMAMPLLLKSVLPTGLLGLVLAAYFSAILSTADSCLMASSGSVTTDLLKLKDSPRLLQYSQGATAILGVAAVGLALAFENVLSLMLYSYAFMVSGLLVPLVAALFFQKRNAKAAGFSMVVGGSTTLVFSLVSALEIPLGLDANLVGILASLLAFSTVSRFR